MDVTLVNFTLGAPLGENVIEGAVLDSLVGTVECCVYGVLLGLILGEGAAVTIFGATKGISECCKVCVLLGAILGKREGAVPLAIDGISECVAIAKLVGSVLGGGKLPSTDGTTERCLVGALLKSEFGSRWGIRLCTVDGAAEYLSIGELLDIPVMTNGAKLDASDGVSE